MDCLFCKIVNKDIPAQVIYEDDQVIAFNDINPQAPLHFLVVPKKHISTLNDINEDERELVGHMVMTAGKISKNQGIAEDGYRTACSRRKSHGMAPLPSDIKTDNLSILQEMMNKI